MLIHSDSPKHLCSGNAPEVSKRKRKKKSPSLFSIPPRKMSPSSLRRMKRKTLPQKKRIVNARCKHHCSARAAQGIEGHHSMLIRKEKKIKRILLSFVFFFFFFDLKALLPKSYQKHSSFKSQVISLGHRLYLKQREKKVFFFFLHPPTLSLWTASMVFFFSKKKRDFRTWLRIARTPISSFLPYPRKLLLAIRKCFHSDLVDEGIFFFFFKKKKGVPAIRRCCKPWKKKIPKPLATKIIFL